MANAQLAYQRFLEAFAGPRWDALAAAGARVQRPLWASTSTKDPSLPRHALRRHRSSAPTPSTRCPTPPSQAFDDHGTLARTLDADPDAARQVVAALAELGIDLEEVAATLEDEGVASFSKSFDELLGTLSAKAESLHLEILQLVCARCTGSWWSSTTSRASSPSG